MAQLCHLLGGVPKDPCEDTTPMLHHCIMYGLHEPLWETSAIRRRVHDANRNCGHAWLDAKSHDSKRGLWETDDTSDQKVSNNVLVHGNEEAPIQEHECPVGHGLTQLWREGASCALQVCIRHCGIILLYLQDYDMKRRLPYLAYDCIGIRNCGDVEGAKYHIGYFECWRARGGMLIIVPPCMPFCRRRFVRNCGG